MPCDNCLRLIKMAVTSAALRARNEQLNPKDFVVANLQEAFEMLEATLNVTDTDTASLVPEVRKFYTTLASYIK